VSAKGDENLVAKECYAVLQKLPLTEDCYGGLLLFAGLVQESLVLRVSAKGDVNLEGNFACEAWPIPHMKSLICI
jgi:hypothetical protein